MSKSSKKVYLDYAATTPVDKEVMEAMLPFFCINYGNASSLHSFGQKSKEVVESSRTVIAKGLNMENREIIFTSGATESNNLTIKGIFNALSRHPNFSTKKLHFITSKIEHPCILDSMKYLEKTFKDLVEVTYLDVDEEGLVDLKDLERVIQKNTVLVSIMFVNNEIGTTEPIKKIGQLIKTIKNQRFKSHNKYPLYFHSDATQAPSYYKLDTKDLNLDLITINAHKIYGPKGVGVLGVKKNTIIEETSHGGGHEFKKRSGTLNVPGIVGLGKAFELAEKQRKENVKKVRQLQDYFINKIKSQIKDVGLNGSTKHRTPNNINFSFEGTEGESVLLMLDQEGIAVSTGSACSSNSLEPSHVLLAIGKTHLQAHSSIRFTLGKFSTKKQLDYTVDKLKSIIEKLRKISKGVKF
ncbi:MAG: aminotransferase class V-fold PLP-dependent enzyme [Candidatus Moranbacteria bacterium]|nr:aminotransferase class V-fold PLP-dependent enzyme [Candidatus Moranbacteria bacterium]